MNVATSAIILNVDKLLIGKRAKGDAFEDKWEFPGGKAEKGETPEQCLKRELLEELGVDATIGRLLYIIDYSYIHKPIKLFVFEVTQIEGEIMLYAHQEVKWVKMEELDKYEFTDVDEMIIKKIRDDLANV